jgi:hypothetical protein
MMMVRVLMQCACTPPSYPYSSHVGPDENTSAYFAAQGNNHPPPFRHNTPPVRARLDAAPRLCSGCVYLKPPAFPPSPGRLGGTGAPPQTLLSCFLRPRLQLVHLTVVHPPPSTPPFVRTHRTHAPPCHAVRFFVLLSISLLHALSHLAHVNFPQQIALLSTGDQIMCDQLCRAQSTCLLSSWQRR